MITLKQILLRILNEWEDETYDTYSEAKANLSIEEWEKAMRSKKGQRQPWDLIPKSQLIYEWNKYVELGFVRNEKRINEWANLVCDNIIKIEINTIISGHTPESPESYVEEMNNKKPTEKEIDKFNDWAVDEHGAWRISDYALEKLQLLCGNLYEAKTAEDKLQLIDLIFSIIHMRSDIASWFVEGGSSTLSELKEKGEMKKGEKVAA